MTSTIPSRMAWLANSCCVQWVMGTPWASGFSHANATIRQICSGVMRAGPPGRSSSLKRSAAERSTCCVQRARHSRTVFSATPNRQATADRPWPCADSKMIRARSTRRCGLVRFRTIASNSFRSSAETTGTGETRADMGVFSFCKDGTIADLASSYSFVDNHARKDHTFTESC